MKELILRNKQEESQKFTFKQLNSGDFDILWNFWQRAMELEHGNNLILPRDDKYFIDILQDPDDVVCGVFIGDKMVAISVYYHIRCPEEIVRKFPHHDCKFDGYKIGIYGSIYVSEEVRGYNLLCHMCDFVEAAHDFDFSIATAKVHNIGSLRGLEKVGYNKIKRVISPIDNAEIYLLIKPQKNHSIDELL